MCTWRQHQSLLSFCSNIPLLQMKGVFQQEFSVKETSCRQKNGRSNDVASCTNEERVSRPLSFLRYFTISPVFGNRSHPPWGFGSLLFESRWFGSFCFVSCGFTWRPGNKPQVMKTVKVEKFRQKSFILPQVLLHSLWSKKGRTCTHKYTAVPVCLAKLSLAREWIFVNSWFLWCLSLCLFIGKHLSYHIHLHDMFVAFVWLLLFHR